MSFITSLLGMFGGGGGNQSSQYSGQDSNQGGGFLQNYLAGYYGMGGSGDAAKAGSSAAAGSDKAQGQAGQWWNKVTPGAPQVAGRVGPSLNVGSSPSIYGTWGQASAAAQQNPFALAWSNMMAQAAQDRAANLRANLASLYGARPTQQTALASSPTWLSTLGYY